MRKLYFIVISIGIILCGYWLITSLPVFINKMLSITSELMTESQFSTSGSFAFKSSPEQPDLIKSMLKISLDFIENPPIEVQKTEKNEIKNFHKLEKFFPNFNYYYIAESKLTDVVFTHFSTLYKEIVLLSDSGLKQYFNNNSENLSKIYGITDYSDFLNIISTIKKLKHENGFKCKLEESYFYVGNSLVLRLILTQPDNSNIYLNAEINIYEATDSQSAPSIKVYGELGGGFGV